MSDSPPRPIAAVWRRVDEVPGMSFCRLTESPEGNYADGAEVAGNGSDGWLVRFELATSPSWVTVSADILVSTREDVRRLALRRETNGRWTADGRDVATLEGALDLDIAGSPFTNTLAIRRLDLTVGEAADIVAAWVDVPSLTVEAVDQRYERLEPANGLDRYEYRSVRGDRGYVMTVDADGLVVDYEDLAERI